MAAAASSSHVLPKGVKKEDDNVERDAFITIANTGKAIVKNNKERSAQTNNPNPMIEYTNSCLFISILDYLKYVMKKTNLTLLDIRQIAQFPGHDNQIFDVEVPGHQASLQRVATHLDICINIYYMNIDHDISGKIIGNWIGNSGFISNPKGKQKISILCYGRRDHFELIISKTKTTPKMNIVVQLPLNKPLRQYRPGDIRLVHKKCDSPVQSIKDLKKDTVLIPTASQIVTTHELNCDKSMNERAKILAMFLERKKNLELILKVQRENVRTCNLEIASYKEMAKFDHDAWKKIKEYTQIQSNYVNSLCVTQNHLNEIDDDIASIRKQMEIIHFLRM
jgi:hypothetical protein